jgi:hypothetical protein
VEQLDTDLTTKEQMQAIARSIRADIIVVGIHGRKGPKAYLYLNDVVIYL